MLHPNFRREISGRYFILVPIVAWVSVSSGQSLITDSINLTNPVPFQISDTALKNQASEKIKTRFSQFKADNNLQNLSISAITQPLKQQTGALPKPGIRKIINPGVKTKGNISLGYEYGYLPYALNAKAPSGNYKTEGEIEFSAFNFPLQLNFHYSDPTYNTGISNHFSIKYDINAYKEETLKRIAAEQEALKKDIGSQLSQQQLIEQKLLYMENLKQQMSIEKPQLPDYNKNLLNTDIPKISPPDASSLINKTDFTIPDKIPGATLPGDSLLDSQKEKAPQLSLDSVNSAIAGYKKQITDIQSTVKESTEKIEKLREAAKNPLAANPFMSKADKRLSGLKKLELGLCYPSWSTFLVSNIPVKGINVEYEKNDWFTSFTYGTTVNNLLFSTTPVQNLLQNTKNLYNFFDFNNVQAGRRIIAAKTGFGAKEKTHLYVGFLYGIGAHSYIRSQENSSQTLYGRERNTVIELDAKYALNPHHSFDFIYGKSSIHDLSFPVEEYKNALEQLATGLYSNAGIVRYNGFLKKTKTKLTLSTRLVDPFFRSFGIAYMRSDNLRYEVKAEQPIKRNLKYTLSLRYDEDNLLNLYQYKTRLYTWGNNLQWKVNKRTTLRVAYNPLLQDIKTGELSIKNKNAISNVVLTYIPKTRKVSMQNTAIYSYYNLTTESQQVNIQNATFTQQVQFRNGFQTGATASWCKNNLSDSLSNNTVIAVLQGGYVFKNGSSVSVAGKAALYKMNDLQGGFSVKGSFALFKHVSAELQAERIVMGEFYNIYDTEQNIKDFPYYFMGRVVYRWE